jgi:cob(I)alamin adenosyltransferase
MDLDLVSQKTCHALEVACSARDEHGGRSTIVRPARFTRTSCAATCATHGTRSNRMEAVIGSGYVHVYTGDGKGKTTAALGLALRAAGAGWNVFIGQFVKGMAYSELDALERFRDRITLRQFGRSCFIDRQPEYADVAQARQGLAQSREAILSGGYRLIVLDEANVAVALGLIELDDLLTLIDARPDPVELVITGRWAHEQIIRRADLVTEMREVKHYYQQGILARTGIER